MAGIPKPLGILRAASSVPVEALEQRLLLSASATEQIAALFLTGREGNGAATTAPTDHTKAKAGQGSKISSIAKPPKVKSHAAPAAAKPKKAPKAAVTVTKPASSTAKPVVTPLKPTASTGSTKKPPSPPAAKSPAPKPPAAKPPAAKPPTTIPTPPVTSVSTTTSKSNPAPITLGQQPGAPDNSQFHGDAARTGFNENETVLTPANVASSFGQIWQSPALDGAVYATPLYEDSITIAGNGNAANHAGDGVQSSSFQNKSLGVVFAATGGGSVYAIAAQDTNGASGIAPGTILWKTHLGNAYSGVDGNSIGVLSTPIIDMASGRLYVTASVTDYLSAASNPNHGGNNFEVFALSIHDGSLITGFPLIYTQALLDSINQNTLETGTGAKAAVQFSSSGADQRGALNLNADGSTLYVDYACYGSSNPGWMTTVATGVSNGVADGQTPAIVSAYSAVDNTSTIANGGMWGAGGPAIDANGNVFVTTGDSPPDTGNPAGDWGNSVLEFGPSQTLTLTGAYTPWNWQAQDTIDSDMGGGSPILVNLPTGTSTTTELLATGGKQGNGYLVDAGNNLNNPTANTNNSPASYPASLTQRPPEDLSPDQDASLYDTTSTGVRTYWTTNADGQSLPAQDGPLALFGPYNESSASGNTAKARDTPTTFTGPDGTQYVVWAGASKSAVGSSTPVAPSLYLTKIVANPGQPAYLQTVTANTAVMSNPGAGLVTGNATANEIYWVVDAGVQRTDSLTSYSDGGPVLYAYNALTMQPIWSSSYEQLAMGGKYNSIEVARGDVFLGTNRIQAFGLTADTIVDDSVKGTGNNQFNYVGSGWQHITGSTTMGTFDGTVSTDKTQGDYATLTFTGSGITVYANETSSYGTATFSIDGGGPQTAVLTPANSSPNGAGAGDVAVFTVSGLSAGTHTLKILNNAASNTISIDRVEIAPLSTNAAQVGVSLTDGNVVPAAQGVIPYTINYNNAGVVGFSNSNGLGTPATTPATGTNAASVLLTDTVGANTTADLANSTAGWTLVSAGPGGTGSAGSTYSYNVGALNAGITGSVVFSVDLNANIPVGTTSVGNSVRLTDAAGDSVTGTRTTPIPPPAETKLVYFSEPPANGSANIPLATFSVAVESQFNNIYTADSSSTVTLTPSSGSIVSGATAQLVNGVATFNNVVFGVAGTYTLTANDGALNSATSSPIIIANSSKLAFTQQPMQTTAGMAINPAVTVAVESQDGTVITTDASTVTLTINQGHFADGSTSETALAVNGVATFNTLAIDTTGSYTLTASDGVLPATQSNSFNIVAVGSRLVFTQQPSTAVVNEAVNPSVAVAVEDGFGNIASGDASTVTLTLSGGTFFGGSNVATAVAVNGVAAFNNLVITATGSYTVTATDSPYSPATSMSFAVMSLATGQIITSIDDNNANNTGGKPQVVYSTPASRWVQSSTSLANNFGGTLRTDSNGGDSASVTFTGTLVTVYAAVGPTAGSAQFFIDGNDPAEVSLYAPVAAIAPVFTSNLLTVGTHTVEVQVSSGNVSIDRFVVGPATPTLVWAKPVDLVYGSALDGTELDAFVSNYANFPGTFNYTPAAGTQLPVGQNQKLSVTFTPTDNTDYTTASASVSINVDKATPLITWLGPDTDMFYGQSLGSNQLDATATVNGVAVPGTIVYTAGDDDTQVAHTTGPNNTLVIDANIMPPTGEDYDLGLTFTPNDTVDYNTVQDEQNVDVDAATPIITWPDPADITDGTPLGNAQLDATANVAGTFTYTPAAGTILPPGQQQSIGVVFNPTDDTDYQLVGASTNINVDFGPAAKLAFVQQPSNAKIGVAMTPPVTVAVEDSASSTITSDNSDVVTLTLSGGATFIATGTSIITATAANGIATFGNLATNTSGNYTLAASENGLIGATSNPFQIGSAINLSFNGSASTFTSDFTSTAFTQTSTPSWSSAAGIDDQDNTTAGGGLTVSGNAFDTTAVFTPFTLDLSDMAVHTISMFVTYPSTFGTGDKPLQIGFLAPGAANVNFNGGDSFISARIYGDSGTGTPNAEFQSGNGSGTNAISIDTTKFAGTVAPGDWLQLVFTTQEVASGSFNGTFAVVDYGATGVNAGRTVLAPVSYSVTGLTTMGTANAVSPGFRSEAGGTASASFDNFAVDSALPAVKFGVIQQPSVGTAGVPLNINPILVLQDTNGITVTSDSSAVTIALTHDTFSTGLPSVTVIAVGGMATFGTLQLNADGSYILRASDTNGAVDPNFDPVVINGPQQLAFITPPANVAAGATMPAVKVAIQDVNGVTIPIDTSIVTLTLSSGTFVSTGTNTMSVAASAGIATFSNIAISATGNYTVTASASDSLEQPASPPAPAPVPVVLTPASASFAVFGAATKLAFMQGPGNSNIGKAINPAVTVAVQDANGNTVATNTATVTLTLSGSGKFASTGTNTLSAAAVAGVASFANLAISPAGVYTLLATTTGLSGAGSASFRIMQPASLTLDDTNSNNAGLSPNQVAYTGNVTASTPAGAFDNTITTLKAVNGSTPAGTATITFTGTQISLYAVESSSAGKATVTLAGGATTTVDTYSATTKDNVLVYTSAIVAYGTHTLTVQYSGTKNASSSGTNIAVDAFVVSDVLPTVTSVQVDGTAWSTGTGSFTSYLSANGLGAGAGFSVADPGQPATLPWNNINQITIGFNEDVNVTSGALGLSGVTGTIYSGAGVTGFSYNSTTHMATWTFANSLPADALTLTLAATVTDKSGNANGLDGAYIDGNSLSSGIGVAGNAFVMHFNVLPGDYNHNGFVNSTDLILVRNSIGEFAAGGTYSPFADVNGNGFVNSTDLILVRNLVGSLLP